jgi:hypothetical protein
MDPATSPSDHPQGPYRTPARPPPIAELPSRESDVEMTVAATVVLVASLVRLVPAFMGREAFGSEPTLALGATLFCAWVGLGALRRRLGERRG